MVSAKKSLPEKMGWYATPPKEDFGQSLIQYLFIMPLI
jgi:hypothetical protein